MNKVLLLGRLTKDPELRTSKNGVPYVRFSVACQRKYKNKDGEYESDFPLCTAWKERAEFLAKWFRKGSRIALEGSIETSKREVNGETRFETTVKVDNIEFAESRGEAGQSTAQVPAREVRSASAVPFEEDIDPTFEPLADSELPF